MSLKNRCIFFHRHFGNHRINPTLLSKVYRIHKIKAKKIKSVKLIDPEKEQEYEQWRKDLITRIQSLRQQNTRIIYLDECVFTSKTILMRDYTNLKCNRRIPQTQLNQPVFALVLAISRENGLEHYQVYDKSVNKYKFVEYLDELYVPNKHESIVLFLDNLGVHKSGLVIEKLDELGIETLYNVPYQPDYNPTESCLSKIKNFYRR